MYVAFVHLVALRHCTNLAEVAEINFYKVKGEQSNLSLVSLLSVFLSKNLNAV